MTPARPATGLDTRTLEIALSAVEHTVALVMEGGPDWRALVEEVEAAAQLEEAIAAREAAPPPPTPPKPQSKPRKRAGKTSDVPPAERREQIVALLRRSGRLSPQEIKAEVPMSSSQSVADFRALIEAGKIRRDGPQTNPTYEAVETDGDRGEHFAATSGGRVLSYVAEHPPSTEAEIAEGLGWSRDFLRGEVGKLIREGELRYEVDGAKTLVVEEPSAG